MIDSQGPIIVVQELAAPISVVWEAITNPERMRAWYFDTIGEFRPEPGFEARFNVHCEGTDYEQGWDYFVRGTLKAYVEEGQVANG
jgi:uncharacterized protein YndB with AHSA1/START domain